MKAYRLLAALIVVSLLLMTFGQASAQLGTTTGSSFTVQNVDTGDAVVSIQFIDASGNPFTPTELNASQPNPFTLNAGKSFEVVVGKIPATQLPAGIYSVVISSTAKVVAIANMTGKGTINFNGSYQAFENGASPFYLPGVVYNYYGWYSLLSVQNVSGSDANISVSIKCNDSTVVGTLTANGVKPWASHTFVLKPGQPDTVVPGGFTAATVCNGSATVTSTQNVIATDNQSIPAKGNTQSYSGVAAGGSTLFVPALYYDYSGWNSSLNIQKLGDGATTVTVAYSNGGTNSCALDNATPSCLLVMKNDHPVAGYFGAKITSTGDMPLVAIANAAKKINNQAQTYNGVPTPTTATPIFVIPAVYKNYYGWRSSFTCQNIGTVDTTIKITYEGFATSAYVHPETLSASTNEAVEVRQLLETFLPATNWHGAVTIEAQAAGASITCIMNYTNPDSIATKPGDWSMSNNAFAK